MKEIKFRAWDKNTKIMIPWDHLVKSRIYFRTFRCALVSENSDNIELMQYTGLKDKNGIEIYEGDILFHPLQGKRKVFYPYSETVASYGLRNVDNGMGSTLQDAHRVWEIIGNCYEKPEPLKEEEQ